MTGVTIREVTRLFNEAGLTISASTVHAIQSQRDDREVGRPNARKIRPLPEWATFQAVGVRGERTSQPLRVREANLLGSAVGANRSVGVHVAAHACT
eukprot:COSAG06_NODE_1206_length_10270_cov_8.055255_9_plen_97_part_00